MSEETQARTSSGEEIRSASGEIEIDAPPERVWRALTEAAELERWFPLEAKVEPGPDGRIWMGWGNEFGAWSPVEVWDPPHHLRISWTLQDGEEASAQITDYRLEGGDGRTVLRVVTSGFPAGADWDDMVEGTRLGWVFELRQLKHYLEHHDGEDRAAAYLRRRVRIPRSDAWDRLFRPGTGVETLAGSVFDRTPPWQLALVSAEPPQGMIRITVDPSHDDPEARDVAVFVAAWGQAAEQVPEVAETWRRRLGQVFPEGQALDA